MPQLQFVFRGWDFLVATQRQVPQCKLHGQVQFLGVVAMPSSWGAVSSGSRGCFFLSVERRGGGGGGAAGGFVCLLAGVGAHHTGDEPM